MPYPIPAACPACATPMHVSELTCPHCNTTVGGQFEITGLYRLTMEQLQFVEVFLRCRGNIKEVERDLKISYPTVRSRLDQVISAMGYSLQGRDGGLPDHNPDHSVNPNSDRHDEVLEALGSGELSFEEALQILKGER